MNDDNILAGIKSVLADLSAKAEKGEIHGLAVAAVDDQNRGMGQYFFLSPARKPLLAEYTLLTHALTHGVQQANPPAPSVEQIANHIKVPTAAHLLPTKLRPPPPKGPKRR